MKFAGFWWRALAYLIDSVILNIAVSIIGTILGISTFSYAGNFDQANMFAAATVFGISGGTGLLITALYNAGMVSSKYQATVGKLAVGMVVTDLQGNRISFLRALGRFFASILSGLVFFIGFLMVGWTARKQGLHDKLAGTLVYKTRDPRSVQNVEGVFA